MLKRGRLGTITLAGLLACVLTYVIAQRWPAPPVERATLASVLFVPLWTGLALAGVAWLRRGRAGHARRSLFALHRQLGGALAVIAMLMFGSGVGAVLDRALASWQLGVAADHRIPPPAEQALDEALAELLRLEPGLGAGALALHPASPEHPWIQANFFDRERRPVRVDLDPATGQVRARGEGPLWVLREFHRRLLIQPTLGESALGLIGLGLGLVLLSGLATRRWLRPPKSTSPRKPPPTAMRAHQWLGLSLLPVATLWAWTGALLGLTLIIVPIVEGAAYGGDRAALMHDVLAVDRPALDERSIAPASLAGLDPRSCPVIADELPGAEIHRILVHHPTHASARIRVDVEDRGLLARASMTVDGDGRLRDCRALPTAGIGLQSFMAAIALHYGEWGVAQVFVDILYMVLGTALVALAWLGGSLLANRREREGEVRGALRLRRTLTCVGFSLGFVLVGLAALSRVPVLARSETAALLTTALLVGAVAIATFTGQIARRRRALSIALALALALTLATSWCS